MDKQKQIEEMAKVVQRDMCGDRPCEECNYHGFETKILPRYCGTYLIAEKIYNAGYRKIPENSVVLTREEYEKFKKQDLFMKDYTIVEVLENETKKACKETAEKLAERLKEVGEIITEYDWNDYLQIDVDYLDEIVKEFTGGKNEE